MNLVILNERTGNVIETRKGATDAKTADAKARAFLAGNPSFREVRAAPLVYVRGEGVFKYRVVPL